MVTDWILVIFLLASKADNISQIPMQDKKACEWAAKRINEGPFAGSWYNKAICITTKTPTEKVEK